MAPADKRAAATSAAGGDIAAAFGAIFAAGRAPAENRPTRTGGDSGRGRAIFIEVGPVLLVRQSKAFS